MPLTLNSGGFKPRRSFAFNRWEPKIILTILIASMAAAGFWIPRSAAAIDLETTVWTKYNNVIPTNSDTTSTNGRIPLGTAGKGDSGNVYTPAVIKDGATYKMWYSGYDGTNLRIYYATSPDGLTWTKYTNAVPANSDTTSTDGRIPLGTSGKGDEYHAYAPTVIKDGATYKMWYSGLPAVGAWRIYYATSSNGLTWAKYNNVVPANSDTTSTDGRIPLGTAGKGDSGYVYTTAVIKDGATYKMWYSGNDGTNLRIYYATSSNGLNWTKYTNAVPANSDTTSTDGRIPLGTAGKGDQTHAYAPTLIKDGATYKMWYSGQDGANYRIYYATSPDGLTWTKYNNTTSSASDAVSTDGRIPLGTSGKGDATGALVPTVIKEGNTYKMWYGGYDGTNFRIYHVRNVPPSGTFITFH
ncbi:MAG: hypothetical protein HYV36_06335 [Lentisphaerae bacterium]|nr:hypothetical protein [Lentisphaerota bacterium]